MSKKTFSILWYVLRSIHLGRFLFLLFFGSLMIIGSIYLSVKPDLPEEAAVVNMEQALSLLQQSEPKYCNDGQRISERGSATTQCLWTLCYEWHDQ